MIYLNRFAFYVKNSSSSYNCSKNNRFIEKFHWYCLMLTFFNEINRWNIKQNRFWKKNNHMFYILYLETKHKITSTQVKKSGGVNGRKRCKTEENDYRCDDCLRHTVKRSISAINDGRFRWSFTHYRKRWSLWLSFFTVNAPEFCCS